MRRNPWRGLITSAEVCAAWRRERNADRRFCRACGHAAHEPGACKRHTSRREPRYCGCTYDQRRALLVAVADAAGLSRGSALIVPDPATSSPSSCLTETERER